MSTDPIGRLIITWPAPGSPLLGHAITLTDADTDEQITSTLDMDLSIHAEPRNLVTAELTMLTTADGQPLPAGATPLLDECGENLLTGRFRWIVAEMRISES